MKERPNAILHTSWERWIEKSKRAARKQLIKERLIIAIACIAAIHFVILFYCIANANAAEQDQWDILISMDKYPVQPGMKGFRVYREGIAIGDITDLVKQEKVFTGIVLLPVTCFTATVFGDDPEQESRHSPKRCVKKPFDAPTMAPIKHFRNYIQAGPVLVPASK